MSYCPVSVSVSELQNIFEFLPSIITSLKVVSKIIFINWHHKDLYDDTLLKLNLN